MAKRGPKPKKKIPEVIHSRNLVTDLEISILQSICLDFEKLGEDQRQRAALFLIHKYPEYFTLKK